VLVSNTLCIRHVTHYLERSINRGFSKGGTPFDSLINFKEEMAKKTRKRYYKRKGRWSANIRTFTNFSLPAPKDSSFFGTTDLCANPVQEVTTVSQQYTVKNIELSFEIETGTTANNLIENLIVYIMYVPQGMTITETYPNQHPEYIMAYRFYGSPNLDNNAEININAGKAFRLKTRMARRLQTGDRVIMLITGTNNSPNLDNAINLNGLVRWWTKAN